MSREAKSIRKLFAVLRRAKQQYFPNVRENWKVPDTHGVYVIYSPRGAVLHVGRTVRGKRGLRQRLYNHLHGSSSFAQKYLDGKGSKLRGSHRFSFIEISDTRTRALVESLAIGILCPKYVGLGQNTA